MNGQRGKEREARAESCVETPVTRSTRSQRAAAAGGGAGPALGDYPEGGAGRGGGLRGGHVCTLG